MTTPKQKTRELIAALLDAVYSGGFLDLDKGESTKDLHRACEAAANFLDETPDDAHA